MRIQTAYHSSIYGQTMFASRTMSLLVLSTADALSGGLCSAHGWFTEGFDTADLQDAKTLLETLGERWKP